MKKLISIALFIFSTSLSAESANKDNSVTIHNTSEVTKQIWISGEEFNIENGSSLRVPCNVGESLYVQSAKNTNLLSCGSSKEINNEY